MEVAALVIPVPWATRSARAPGSVESRSAGTPGSARTVVTWPTGAVVARSARTVVTWPTRPTWAAGPVRSGASRSAGTLGSTRSAGATGTARSVASTRVPRGRSRVANCRRSAVGAAATGWASGRGTGRTSTHTQRGSSKGARDGSPRHQLLQPHCPSPVYLGIEWTFAPHVSNVR